MGRPSLGSRARNIQARVKISSIEEEHMIVTSGSVGRHLRRLIDAEDDAREEAREKVRRAGRVTPEKIAEVMDVPVEVLGHRHRRHEIVGTRWDAGMKVDVWRCECGKTLE